MSTMEAVLDEPQALVEKRQVVNDFSIQVATANGSGSQTSNMVLLRAIFQMGMPVSGKNLFPSNIRVCPPGLPCASIKTATSRGGKSSNS